MKPILPVALAFCALQPLAAHAAEFNEAQKQEIGETVREYLLANPEVLIEAMSALESKRAAEAAESRKQAVAAAGDAIFQTPEGSALGNPQGDVTLVEFFDYNCGYCKRAHADMQALLESDPNLKIILRELPVLGDDSIAASRVSLAFRSIAPAQYGAFQDQLLTSRTPANEARALEVAAGFGASEEALRKAMQSPQVTEEIDSMMALAYNLQITGTPSYVVGDEVISGAVGADSLAEKIANVRKCGSATCT